MIGDGILDIITNIPSPIINSPFSRFAFWWWFAIMGTFDGNDNSTQQLRGFT